MNCLLTLIAVLIALVAATVPSAAVSSRGFVQSPAAILMQSDSGTYLQAPCLLKNSKRLTQCRPDITVVPAGQAMRIVPPVIEQAELAELMPLPLFREPSLPPPRLG